MVKVEGLFKKMSSVEDTSASAVIRRKIGQVKEASKPLTASSTTPTPEELEQLIAEKKVPKNIRFQSNLSRACGVACAAFGGGMFARQQATAISGLSLWAAGSYFFINGQLRRNYGKERDMLMNDTAAAALWMMASLKQFKQTQALKWAGYSSWSAFIMVTYYATKLTIMSVSDEDE